MSWCPDFEFRGAYGHREGEQAVGWAGVEESAPSVACRIRRPTLTSPVSGARRERQRDSAEETETDRERESWL